MQKYLNQTDYYPYRVIYYRDQNNKVLRRVLINNDNQIVRNYLYKKRKDGQQSCLVLFGSDHVTPLGVKEFIL